MHPIQTAFLVLMFLLFGACVQPTETSDLQDKSRSARPVEMTIHESNVQAEMRAAIKSIGSAIQMFQTNNGGHAPDTLDMLIYRDALGARYLDSDELPRDPFGRVYSYQAPHGANEWGLWSYGKDGTPGGEGLDADLSWQMLKNGK